MKQFLHGFDVCIAKTFTSDVEDFDQAFDAWIGSFPDRESLRKELLRTEEGTKSIIKGISYGSTEPLES